MTKIDNIIHDISHRPWTLPNGQWNYYQEWNNVLFLHWKVPEDELLQLIPSGVMIDKFNGETWVSLVAFTMEKIRPRMLPSVSTISDFHEVNVRTYLIRDNKPGVYFLTIEAEKLVSTFVAKYLSGLPYEKTLINRQQQDITQKYFSKNERKGFTLDASFTVGQKVMVKSEIDRWLTERYCLYLNKNNQVYRYEIHHKPWELYQVEISNLITNYKIGEIFLNRKPDLTHYSDGVKVVAWKRENIPEQSTSH